MEKQIKYNNVDYVVSKNGTEVTILKKVNDSLLPLTDQELEEVVNFIGGKIVKDETAELKEEINKQIEVGEIHTIDEIIELLDKKGVSEEKREELLEEFKQTLNENIYSSDTEEELDKYREEIKEYINKPRKKNEFMMSEFSMVNGVMKHHLVTVEVINGEITQKEVMSKGFDYNQRFIDHLLEPTIVDSASSGEHYTNEYALKTNITGDTADYTFASVNNVTLKINDISKAYADKIVKLVNDTKVEDHNIVEEEAPLDESKYPDTFEQQEENYNSIVPMDERNDELQLEQEKKHVRVRAKKEYKNAGFMSFKYWLLITIALGVGLFLLTKFVIFG